MSISTSRVRLIPEVTSPVDRATMVFYLCFVDIYSLSCTVSTLLALLLSPKMADRRFRPLGGVFDFLTSIWYGSPLEFVSYLSSLKSNSTFSICMSNVL
jgi:hypothetical protein